MSEYNELCEHCTTAKPEWPTIDHSRLSPNGSVSARARKAFQQYENERMSGYDAWLTLTHIPTAHEECVTKAETLFAHAKRLNELADRGMCVRKYRKEALKAIAQGHEALNTIA